MRTIPSVTETTVPWLRMSALADRPWIRLLISSEISAGLSCMTLSFFLGWANDQAQGSGRQSHFHLFQTGLDRSVEHLVTHHHADTADQFGVELNLDVELAAEAFFQRGRHIHQGAATHP